MSVTDEWLKDDEAKLEAAGLMRRLEPLESSVGAVSVIAGKQLANFSSNDYLGLAAHPRVVAAATACLAEFGVGTGASRLVVGDTVIHQSLEAKLAQLKNTETATLFNSGYAANAGALGALVREGDLILSDALNHASLIDGCRLSRAEVRVFRHKDLAQLEWLLKARRGFRRKVVVTDAVFSMDGDLAPLKSLRALCDQYGAALYVDEAHSAGVFGVNGAGLLAQLGLKADIVMGTLSKAFGAMGAYVGGSSALRNVLLSKARPLIFSTAFPAAVAAAAQAALAVVADEPQRQAKLWANINRLKTGLRNHDFDVDSQSAIFSIVLQTPERALKVAAQLRAAGMLVKAIRPPTVAVHTSRLRIALSATHSEEQVDQLLSTLDAVVEPAYRKRLIAQDLVKSQFATRASQEQQVDAAHARHPFSKMHGWARHTPLVIERAEGNFVFDTDGNAFLDGVASFGGAIHGHRHPTISQAIHRQVDAGSYSSVLKHASVPSIELAKCLIEIAPNTLNHVFYSDSGRAAIDLAVKMAHQFWQSKGQTLKQKILALSESPMSNTSGPGAVGKHGVISDSFKSEFFEVEQVATPNAYRWPGDDVLAESVAAVETVLKLKHHQIAALVIEPVLQSRAGMLVQPKGLLSAVARLCTQYGVLLICDETATGFGCTGTMFAVEHEEVRPDLLCIGEGLGAGGFKLAATLAADNVCQRFLGECAQHETIAPGLFYAANPVACAAAVANLKVFESERTLNHVNLVAAHLNERLAVLGGHSHVGDIRQLGLMVGVELVVDKVSKARFPVDLRVAFQVCLAVQKRGVLLGAVGDVVAIAPSLSLSVDEADQLLDALTAAIHEVLPSV